ncbi:tetratricopeptide repeat protein [Candidatus Auribacterota bacterium]
MKKLLFLALLVIFISGCALNRYVLREKMAVPEDAVLFYLDNIHKPQEKKALYSILADQSKEYFTSASIRKKVQKENIFTGKKIVRNMIISRVDLLPGRSIVYDLLVLAPEVGTSDQQALVFKFETMLQQNEWKIYLALQEKGEVDIFPIYLNINKKRFDRTDLEIIKQLIENDTVFKKGSSKNIVSLAGKVADKQREEQAVVVDQRLKTLQKCYRLGEELFAKEKYQEAIMQFQKVLALDPKAFNAQAYIERCKKKLNQ